MVACNACSHFVAYGSVAMGAFNNSLWKMVAITRAGQEEKNNSCGKQHLKHIVYLWPYFGKRGARNALIIHYRCVFYKYDHLSDFRFPTGDCR